MSTEFSVLEHSKNFVDLALPYDPNVVRFRINVARTLNTAYVGQGKPGPVNGVVGIAGNDTILTVEQGQDLITTRLRRKRLGILEESTRGMTRVKYDPDEFVGATFPSAPPDQDFAYVRLQEFRHTGLTFGPEGPIHIIPGPGFLGSPHPIINIVGTAPKIAGTAAGVKPLAGSMVISLPQFMGSFSITNADGANSLFISFDAGMPMREILSSTDIFTEGTGNYLIIAAPGANPGFSISGQVMNSAI